MLKVWHRKHDGWWYVTLSESGGRKQIKLVKAPDDREGKKKAEAQLLVELKDRDYEPDVTLDAEVSWITVAHVLDGFLKHSEQEHDPTTSGWYRNFFASFKEMWGRLKFRRLKKRHVRAWLRKKKYNPTSQNRAIGAIQRAFAWAVEEEHISKSPIAHMKKPKSLVRDRVLTPDERALILASIGDAYFRDYVAGLTLTGARPGEVARVCPAMVNLDVGVWVFEKHKTAKKTGRPRIIYLSPEALELTRRLMGGKPADEPLFLNTRGHPWSRNAVRIRFRRLRKKYPELKGVIAYTYRSSFATDALEAGVPDATVAQLLGHSNTSTLHKFYARLSHKVEHLQDAAKRATRSEDDTRPGTP